MAIEILISGLIIGILFGWILQRGRFCFNSAIRDPLIFKDFTLIKGVFLALALSMITFSMMAFSGLLSLSPNPSFGQTNLLVGLSLEWVWSWLQPVQVVYHTNLERVL